MNIKKKVILKTLFLIPFHMPLILLFLMMLPGLIEEIKTLSMQIIVVLITIVVELLVHILINIKLYNVTINVKDANALKLSNTIIVLFIISFYLLLFTLPQIL